MHFVKKINYIDGYKISLTFDDKKIKIVDLEPYLDKGVFLPLRDQKYFNRVRLISNTLVWPNEADFCHDVLYEIGKDVEEETKSKPKQARYKRDLVYAMSKKRSNKVES